MTRPRCSVIIPVHNKAGLTKQCLESILRAAPETPHELIVVDDASTDSTREVLAGFGDSVRVVERSSNAGFAAACNAGFAVSVASDCAVFLNNDTMPLPGWLDALVRDADLHPEAAAIGSKLLYPDGTLQHAGVVICQDGMPRHLYQGFPGDHPATANARTFQAVTAACMLVRREAFEEVGGFDPAYRNCLEDVDLCLSLGGRGHKIHYCPEAVVVHYESASRGRRSKEIDAAVRLYRSRWGGRVRPDDLDYYVEDGLLRVTYHDAYPFGLSLSPRLAVLKGEGSREADQVLESALRQVFDLLRETIRLTIDRTGKSALVAGGQSDVCSAPTDLLDRASRIEADIADVQEQLENRGRSPASPYLLYRKLSEETRSTVERVTPPGSTVLVVSRGDERLIALDGRHGRHFPQDQDGFYAGYHPATNEEAVAHLEHQRSSGAGYLAFPQSAMWWLDYYDGFARHLTERYTLLTDQGCAVYALEEHGGQR